MLRIRSLVLNGIALFGITVSVIATLNGYVHNLPERVEHVVSAIEKLDVEITGSITHPPVPSSSPDSAPRP
jgi:hypothetical protein